MKEEFIEIAESASGYICKLTEKYYSDIFSDAQLYIVENKGELEKLEPNKVYWKIRNHLVELYIPKQWVKKTIYRGDIEKLEVADVDPKDIQKLYRLDDNNFKKLVSGDLSKIKVSYSQRFVPNNELSIDEFEFELYEELDSLIEMKQDFYDHIDEFDLTDKELKFIELCFAGYDFEHWQDVGYFMETLGVKRKGLLKDMFCRIENKLMMNSPFRSTGGLRE